MAAYSGTAGSVVYMTGGTTTVGEITEWSLDLGHTPVEITSFGDNWQEYIPSIRNASGSFAGNADMADSAQTSLTNAMLGGSAVALRLYMGTAKYWNIGTAYLTAMSPSISQAGKGDISYDFQVSGPVTLI